MNRILLKTTYPLSYTLGALIVLNTLSVSPSDAAWPKCFSRNTSKISQNEAPEKLEKPGFGGRPQNVGVRIQERIDRYNIISEKTFEELFPEVEIIEELPKDAPSAAKLTAKNIAEFNRIFDDLIGYHEEFDHVPANFFRAWLKTKFGQPYPVLDRFTVENFYKRNKYSVEKFLEDLYYQYLIENKSAGLSAIENEPKTIGAKFRSWTGRISKSFLSSLQKRFIDIVVIGSIVPVYQNYVYSVQNTINQTAQQRGAIDLSWVATALQSFISAHIDKVNIDDLGSVTWDVRKIDFKNLSREDSRKLWEGYEKRYFELFMRISKTLPSHLREGRSYVRDWTNQTPLTYVTSLSTHEILYWQHRTLKDSLQKEIRAKKRKATLEEKQLLSIYGERMEAAEARIAGTLASIKLFEFMYPEVSRESLKGVTEELQGSYNRFMTFMRVDVYTIQFTDQVGKALKEIDPSFEGLDQISTGGALKLSPTKTTSSSNQP